MEGHFEVKPELFEVPQSVLEVSLSFHKSPNMVDKV